MARRTKEAARETREGIIDAAERVFHERGVAHASLEEVAAAARVTRGAIYWHFKDKADLFEAMMERVVLPAEDIRSRARGCTLPHGSLGTLRDAAVDVLLRTATDARVRRIYEIAYHKCEYVGDAVGVKDRHRASQQECLQAIEAGFRASVASGELPKSVNPKVAAMGAMSLVSGLIANWVLDPDSFALKRHAQALVDTYIRGLAATPAARRKTR